MYGFLILMGNASILISLPLSVQALDDITCVISESKEKVK